MRSFCCHIIHLLLLWALSVQLGADLTAQEWLSRYQWSNVEVLPTSIIVDSDTCVLLRSIPDSTWSLIAVSDLQADPWADTVLTLPDRWIVRQVVDADGDGHQDLIVDSGTVVAMIRGPLSATSQVVPISRRPLLGNRDRAKLEEVFDIDHDGIGDYVETYWNQTELFATVHYGDSERPFEQRTEIRTITPLTVSTGRVWMAEINGVNCLLQYGAQDPQGGQPFRLDVYTLDEALLSSRPDTVELSTVSASFPTAQQLDLTGTFRTSEGLMAFRTSGDLVRIAPAQIGTEQAHPSWLWEGYRGVLTGTFWDWFQTNVAAVSAGGMVVRGECFENGGVDRPLRITVSWIADAPGLPLEQIAVLRTDPVQCVADPHGNLTIRRSLILPDIDGDGLNDLMISYGPINDTISVITAVYASSDQLPLHVDEDEPESVAKAPCPLEGERMPVFSVLGQRVASVRVRADGSVDRDELAMLPQMPLWAVGSGCVIRIR